MKNGIKESNLRRIFREISKLHGSEKAEAMLQRALNVLYDVSEPSQKEFDKKHRDYNKFDDVLKPFDEMSSEVQDKTEKLTWDKEIASGRQEKKIISH